MLKRTLFFLLLLLMMVSLLPAVAQADARPTDTDPPTLTNVTLSKTTVAAGGSVTVTVTATDELSEVSYCEIRFRKPNTSQRLYANLSQNSAGKWTGTLTPGEYAVGDYYIDYVNLYDTAGNSVSYVNTNLGTYGYNNEQALPDSLTSQKLTVTNSNGDTQAPTLTNLTLGQTTVAAPGSVAVT